MASINRKPVSKNKKGEKKMTEQSINYQRAKEDERHNKAEEERKEKERKTDFISKVGSGIGGAVGSLIGGINDPSWYNIDKQMVKDTAQISFNNPLGAKVASIGGDKYIPGIMAIKLGHTVGINAAANNAAKNIYAYVRYANSGSKNYEPNDIMAYILQMCDVYSYHAYLCRIYSLALTAKGHNKYYFDGMLQACGVDPQDIRDNLANLRAFINSYAMRANAFYAPKNIPLFQRRYWLYVNIFKDMPIKKSQEYLFNPYTIGLYDDTTSILRAQGYKAWSEDTNTATGLGSFKKLKQFGDTIINTLLSSASFGIMSGDILKAYGESNVHTLPSIDANFHIESIYSAEVLSQIHNASFLGEVQSEAITIRQFDIACPAGGTILQGFRGTSTSTEGKFLAAIHAAPDSTISVNMHNKILNFYKDDPTPDDLMVATRLMTIPEDFNASSFTATTGGATFYEPDGSSVNITRAITTINAVGTEIAMYCDIYTFKADGTFEKTWIPCEFISYPETVAIGNMNASLLQQLKNIIKYFDVASKFDYCPIFYPVDSLTGEVKFNNMEAANTASINEQVLSNMHYTAVLSEYGIPLLGSSVRSRR